MPRAKNRVQSRRRRKAILKRAKGYFGSRKSQLKLAKQAVDRAGQYAFRDRRSKKREARALWIIKINAACRQNGISYSRFISGLKKGKVEIDRKILAYLAEHDGKSFAEIVHTTKAV